MHALKWLVIAIALFQGAWLVFDGTRALRVGDYVTPTSGPRAGQLGPWSRVVSALGLDPRSALIKWLHVALGLTWLFAAVLFLLRPSSLGWWAILGAGIASLWYLPLGTLLSAVVLALLWTPAIKP